MSVPEAAGSSLYLANSSSKLVEALTFAVKHINTVGDFQIVRRICLKGSVGLACTNRYKVNGTEIRKTYLGFSAKLRVLFAQSTASHKFVGIP